MLAGMKSECLISLSNVPISFHKKLLSSDSTDAYVPFCWYEWDNWPFLILERQNLKATWFVVKVFNRHYRDVTSLVRFLINNSALLGTASVTRETRVSWNISTKGNWSKTQIRQELTCFQWQQILTSDRHSQKSRQEEWQPACQESIHQPKSAWHFTDDLLQKKEWCFWSQPDWLVLSWAKYFKFNFLMLSFEKFHHLFLLTVAKSWADVVKLGTKQTQTKVVKHVPQKQTSKRPRRPNTPKVQRSSHALLLFSIAASIYCSSCDILSVLAFVYRNLQATFTISLAQAMQTLPVPL